jgi:hypothetical protein
MLRSTFILSLATSLVLGCGGSSFIEPGEAVDGGALAETSPVETSGADSGGADSGSALDDSAPATDSSADIGNLEDRIDPIAVGRSWSYNVEVLGNYLGCSPGKHDGKVLRAGSYQGRNAFEVQSFCEGFGSSWYSVVGDVVDLYYSAWIRVVDAPVTEGHTWTSGTSTITWRDMGSVTVPAGTFSRCYRAEANVGYPSYTVFCRGVGPVRWYTKDKAGNGYDAQLVSKSF